MNKYNIHTNSLGLARSLLALGSLLTLLCNSYYILFPEYHFLQVRGQIRGIEKMNLFFLFDYSQIAIPYYIALFVLSLVILGVYPRITCLLHAWVSYSIYHSLLIIEGGDQITAILSLLLVPICIIDRRVNHWRNDAKPVSSYFLRYFSYCALIFIHLQMALLYLNAGVEKLKVPEWTEGTAVYYWFNHNVFGAPHWLRDLTRHLFSNPIIMTLVNWGVIILEMLLFTANFLKLRYKYILFLAGSLFHFLIFIIHGLPTFWIAMVGGLVLYLWRMDFTILQNIQAIKRLVWPFFTKGTISLAIFRRKYKKHPEGEQARATF